MSSDQETGTPETRPRPYTVRLPGFVNDEDVGLGDVIKRATYSVGIKPCGGRRGEGVCRATAIARSPRMATCLRIAALPHRLLPNGASLEPLLLLFCNGTPGDSPYLTV
jgi:hypothetical protein